MRKERVVEVALGQEEDEMVKNLNTVKFGDYDF